MTKASTITLNAFSEKYGIERRESKKHLLAESVPHTRENGQYHFDAKKAEAVAKAILERREKRGVPGIDPKTGLTWGQKLAKEKARETELKNIQTERQQSEDWISADAHLSIVRSIINKIEQASGKAKSQLGLNDSQTVGLTKILDECRESAAKEVEKV